MVFCCCWWFIFIYGSKKSHTFCHHNLCMLQMCFPPIWRSFIQTFNSEVFVEKEWRLWELVFITVFDCTFAQIYFFVAVALDFELRHGCSHRSDFKYNTKESYFDKNWNENWPAAMYWRSNTNNSNHNNNEFIWTKNENFQKLFAISRELSVE